MSRKPIHTEEKWTTSKLKVVGEFLNLHLTWVSTSVALFGFLLTWVAGRRFLLAWDAAFRIPQGFRELTTDQIIAQGAYPALIALLSRWGLLVAVLLVLFIGVGYWITSDRQVSPNGKMAFMIVYSLMGTVLIFLAIPNIVGASGVQAELARIQDPITKDIKPEFLCRVLLSSKGLEGLPEKAQAIIREMNAVDKSECNSTAKGVFIAMQTSDRIFIFFPTLHQTYSVFRSDLLQVAPLVGPHLNG